MEELKEIIEKCELKKEFTEDEKDELWYTYSRNLLLASYDFKYVDKTFSDLFLMMSKMCLNNLSGKWQPTLNNEGQGDAAVIESKLHNLEESEREKIMNEIKEIEESL